MKKGLCEIVAIVDRSGSMGAIKNDAIGGFNEFLVEQRRHPGEAIFSHVEFNTEYDMLLNGVPLNKAVEYTAETYQPDGFTALLDAVAKTILDVGNRLASTSEDKRPEKVIVFILTDGEENSSKEYTKAQVKEMVERQQSAYNWSFVFCGANVDSFAEAAGMGIDRKFVRNYDHSGDGIRDAYHYTSGTVSQLRTDNT